jgi:glycosyltransferase involved in cell wall biosynthesis
MVVNNSVAHDARVIKTAVTMARAGADVQVLGVSGSRWRERAVSSVTAVTAGSSGAVAFERLPVLPQRGVTPPYVLWAVTRRFSRVFRAERWRRSLPVTRYYRRAFLPALGALAPDAVHVHDVHLLGVVAEYAAGASPRPQVVYDAHEYVAGLAVSGARTQRSVDGWGALERELIPSADRVITVSDGLAERLQSLHHLQRRPAVVHNAPVAWANGEATPSKGLATPDKDLATGRSLREECGIEPGVTLAVYSGALSAARGVDTAVEALGLLPDLHLAVVAVPYPHPMAARLQEIAASSGALDRLHLVPPVPSHEVPSYLSAADVAVSPILGDSVSYDEALPNKLFEYLHAGLPMVVSDCRAMAHFVAEHGLGEVFGAGDAHDLARALREVLGNPPHPDTTALLSEYSWQGQEPRLVAVYDDLFAGLGLQLPDTPITPDSLMLRWSRVDVNDQARPSWTEETAT